MPRVYIALGTNLGRRWDNLALALEGIRAYVEIDAVSSVYETAPWGYADQPDFLNAVATGLTSLSPRALLERLKELEWDMGRRPTVRYGPRVIDLDILFYGHARVNEPDLCVPHPRLHERAFVLVPLADVAQDFIHPILGRRVGDLLADVDTSTVRRAVP